MFLPVQRANQLPWVSLCSSSSTGCCWYRVQRFPHIRAVPDVSLYSVAGRSKSKRVHDSVFVAQMVPSINYDSSHRSLGTPVVESGI
ncbi:hypothetical protein PLICRDRAFT_42703 [Plicaturopsis crispa FD-325 SS-3]|nr:hypothetical protein PLICRDRAFT_42703 [Plicaturopsis crispa FD-325 SS-3]